MSVRPIALVLALLVAWAAPVRAQSLQIHRAVVPDAPGDTDGMREMEGPTGPVWVGEMVLSLDDGAIETVGLETDHGGGTLSLWLSAEAGAAFADLTAQSIGQALAVVRDGIVLTAPVVQSEIPNGLVLITGLGVAEAESLASVLRGETSETLPEPTPAPVEIAERPPVRLDPPAPPAADDGTAAQVAVAFARAVAARRWAAAADRLHPAALAAIRPDAVAILRFDGSRVRIRDGLQEGAFEAEDVLGRRLRADRPGLLSDRDLAALHLAALDVLGVWGDPGPPRSVAGSVTDGDRVHVVLRPETRDEGVASVSVVTLARDGGNAWRVLLTEAQGF